jgi:hypothetical protein
VSPEKLESLVRPSLLYLKENNFECAESFFSCIFVLEILSQKVYSNLVTAIQKSVLGVYMLNAILRKLFISDCSVPSLLHVPSNLHE